MGMTILICKEAWHAQAVIDSNILSYVSYNSHSTSFNCLSYIDHRHDCVTIFVDLTSRDVWFLRASHIYPTVPRIEISAILSMIC
jgi:hypothetical protein